MQTQAKNQKSKLKLLKAQAPHPPTIPVLIWCNSTSHESSARVNLLNMHYSSNSNSKLNLKPKLKLKCKPKLKSTLKSKLKFQIKLNQSHRLSYTKLKLFKTQAKVQYDLQASNTSQLPIFQLQLWKIVLFKNLPRVDQKLPRVEQNLPRVEILQTPKSPRPKARY